MSYPHVRRHSKSFSLNDGSRDASWPVVESLAEQSVSIRGIDLMRNYGQHNAVLAGIRAARHDVIVTLDDDLQHPPEEIHVFLRDSPKGSMWSMGTPDRERHVGASETWLHLLRK
jgi:glycosyltransferase involved in cell wall biosynthesis